MMKFMSRFSSWFRSLFHSDDILLRVFLADGRMLYDKHPLVRHGVITSFKHEMAFSYSPPVRVYRFERDNAPPVYVGQEYYYDSDKELDPMARIEAMHGFYQDGMFGIDHQKLVGPVWRRHVNLHTIFRRSCTVGSTAFLLYTLARNDFEGLQQLVIWFKGWLSWSQSLIAEEPNWVILIVTSALLPVLLGGLMRMTWSRLRGFGRRKPRWWDPPSD